MLRYFKCDIFQQDFDSLEGLKGEMQQGGVFQLQVRFRGQARRLL